MKRILILGVTGSIGLQSLDCLEGLELVGCSYGNNTVQMQEIIRQFPNLFIYSPLNNSLNNVDSWEELFQKTRPALVLNAIVGWAGLEATMYCLEHGYKLALANKESLVIAGFLIRDKQFLPVDSEHSSLHELMQIDPTNVDTIYITASGGPFYQLSTAESFNKKFSEALKHPNWSMGAKISVDSATLVNKCFELIEAHHLFPNCKIRALYHPQSIVHSLVQFKNGSILANMSTPDMHLAIDLALHNFQRGAQKIPSLDFNNLNLNFSEIDDQKWLPIAWAKEVIETDNRALGVIINTVNDHAFQVFRNGQIPFGMITIIIDHFVKKYRDYKIESFGDLLELHDLIQHDLEDSNDNFWSKK